MTSTSSAVPSPLIDHPVRTRDDITRARSAAAELHAALLRVRSTCSDLVRLPSIDDEIVALVTRLEREDEWVARVGDAFLAAGARSSSIESITAEWETVATRAGFADQRHREREMAAVLGEAQDARTVDDWFALRARLDLFAGDEGFASALYEVLGGPELYRLAAALDHVSRSHPGDDGHLARRTMVTLGNVYSTVAGARTGLGRGEIIRTTYRRESSLLLEAAELVPDDDFLLEYYDNHVAVLADYNYTHHDDDHHGVSLLLSPNGYRNDGFFDEDFTRVLDVVSRNAEAARRAYELRPELYQAFANSESADLVRASGNFVASAVEGLVRAGHEPEADVIAGDALLFMIDELPLGTAFAEGMTRMLAEHNIDDLVGALRWPMFGEDPSTAKPESFTIRQWTDVVKYASFSDEIESLVLRANERLATALETAVQHYTQGTLQIASVVSSARAFAGLDAMLRRIEIDDEWNDRQDNYEHRELVLTLFDLATTVLPALITLPGGAAVAVTVAGGSFVLTKLVHDAYGAPEPDTYERLGELDQAGDLAVDRSKHWLVSVLGARGLLVEQPPTQLLDEDGSLREHLILSAEDAANPTPLHGHTNQKALTIYFANEIDRNPLLKQMFPEVETAIRDIVSEGLEKQ